METGARILFIDLETSPSLGYTWQKYQTDVIEFLEHWHLLCVSWKWKGGEQVTKGLCDYRGYKAGSDDDEALTKEVWHVLKNADIVVAHNGDKFDIKKLNTRFSYHHLTPPGTFKTVDTLKEARKWFGFESNRLDDLCEQLGIGRKMEHNGFEVWKGCMAGDKDSWATMKAYNAQDVVLLEGLYDRILPWMTHPNLGMYCNGTVCSKCGGTYLRSEGWRRNATTKYRRVKCMDCGSWMRTAMNEQETKPLVAI